VVFDGTEREVTMTPNERHRKRPAVSLLGAVVLGAALMAAATQLAFQNEEEATPAEEFESNVATYAALHRELARTFPDTGKEEAPPEHVLALRHDLAEAIRHALPDARIGHILSGRVRTFLASIIREEVSPRPGDDSSSEAAARETALGEGNPTHEPEPGTPPVELKVLGEYATEAPLSTVPPTLLGRLPQLPEELEYRFVGPHLILRDKGANIIVDYVPNALNPE
jgi:hypothetical protein